MKGPTGMYYDEESDYFEIFVEGASPTFGEEIGDDITVIKSEKTDEVVGVGILNFRKRAKSLHNIRISNLPFQLNFSALKNAVSSD